MTARTRWTDDSQPRGVALETLLCATGPGNRLLATMVTIVGMTSLAGCDSSMDGLDGPGCGCADVPTEDVAVDPGDSGGSDVSATDVPGDEGLPDSGPADPDVPGDDGPPDPGPADPGTPDPGVGPASLGKVSPSVLQAEMATKDFLLINVHVPYAGQIPGTDTHLTYANVDAIAAYIGADVDRRTVVYCLTNSMSTSAGNQLVARGYRAIRYLDGGMIAWKNAGYPFESD